MRWCVFPGVPEQIGQGLGQRGLIPVHHQPRLQAHPEIDLGAEANGFEGDQRLVDDVGHGNRSTIKGGVAGFDPGNGQKLCHQSIEARQLLMNHGQAALLLGRIVDPILAQGIDEETDRSQGRAQLVRDRGKKLVLHSRKTSPPTHQDGSKHVASQGCPAEAKDQNPSHHGCRLRSASGQQHDPDNRDEHRRDQRGQHEDHAGALQEDDGR